MAVRITQQQFSPRAQVDLELVLATVEKNRDRIRTTGGMLMTFSGILTSSSIALTLFLVEKMGAGRMSVALFSASVFGFLSCAVLAIVSSFLRGVYPISDRTQFVSDVLHLYNSELRLLRLCSLMAIVGLLFLAAGTITFAVNRG